jgi:predicted nuclease with TOPRIM domain
MTDNEIIRALECCSKSSWLNDCEGCPCYDETEDIQTSECQERLMKNALDLINRQKAELDKLAEEYGELIIEKDELFDIAEKQKAEIERLEKDSKRLKKVQMQLDDAMKMYSTIKAEAVKEFADEFKKIAIKDKSPMFRIPYYQISVETFDNLVKERVGEC